MDVTEQDVINAGPDYIAWVLALATDRDCHISWTRGSRGGLQPIFWDLPGDRHYKGPKPQRRKRKDAYT